jgi:hypothetical protein
MAYIYLYKLASAPMIKRYFSSSFFKLEILIALAALLFSTALIAQPVFQRSFSNVGFEKATCVIQTNDGGFLEGGTTGTSNFGLTDFYLVKTDGNGNVQWSKSYGGNVSEYLAAVIQTADGGYMICGTTYSFNTQPYGNIYLIKTDANGAITWQRHYGGNGNDYGNSIQQTADGGYIVGGLTSTVGYGLNDYYLMKLDALGMPVWGTAIGASYQDEGYSVLQTEDGGYAIAGKSNSFTGPHGIMLCKLNGSGALLWSKTYVGGVTAGYYICNVLRQTADEGFVMVGYTDASGTGLQDVLVVKTDSLGVHQWSKAYGGTNGDFGNDIRETANGYAIAGYTNSFGAGNQDAYVITTDAGGNVQWSICYGDTAFDWATSINHTSDGGFAIAGQTSATGSSNADFYLIKCDASGFTGCNQMNVTTVVTTLPTIEAVPTPALFPYTNYGTASAIAVSGGTATTLCTTVGASETVVGNETISLYPDPANELLSFSKALDGVEVFDVFGKSVIAESGMVQNISVRHLADGIYFIRSGDHVQRFVVQH